MNARPTPPKGRLKPKSSLKTAASVSLPCARAGEGTNFQTASKAV
ncbi:hypothetical protein [Neisseria bacilliformis]|nr:hypothetical protein [Neisseria bacilliformis]